MFAHSGIAGCGHLLSPLGLRSHRLFGHPASLEPDTDIRP